MKYILLIIVSFVFIQCSIDKCFSSSGENVTETIKIEPFEHIYVFKGIAITIHQSNEYKLVIKTGKNIKPYLKITNANNVLTIKDELDCNLVRDYGVTHIDIFAPNITEIHSRTEKNISSHGTLTYPNLSLISIDLEEGAGLGDFHMQLNCKQLIIGSNNVSGFYISGKSEGLSLGVYSGAGRFHLENLHVSQKTSIFHRGLNDVFIYPKGELIGNLYGNGNLILKHKPTYINIKQHFNGRLIHDY